MFYTYLFGNKNKSIYKVGFSQKKRGLEARLKEVQTGFPYKLEVFCMFETKYGPDIEKALHRTYCMQKKDQDEEELTGEWFYLSEQDVLDFEKNCIKIDKNYELILNNNTFDDKNKLF
jgi:hypothetical protein